LRDSGLPTGFLDLVDYDKKIASGTVKSSYPTDLENVDPFELAVTSKASGKDAKSSSSSSSRGASTSAYRPEAVHAHPRSLLRCLGWEQCKRFPGFSGHAYQYWKLGADASSWHREQLDGDTVHEQISGASCFPFLPCDPLFMT
jgi:hypothetical protein